ncbi:hypothetical protein [Amycolatopsis orientalis]|uniref:hypothetical protein n=1 Tax=Amycolatopsis orientalis TaxID=31958 RepID=UPI0011AB7AE0|nr:hypothetical protein [Amycolatopsis orientalis]
MRADEVDVFVEVSSELTGFSARELLATGMAETYHATVSAKTGAVYGEFVHALRTPGWDPRTAGGSVLELAQAVTRLWYLGVWPALSEEARVSVGMSARTNRPFVVSPRAYAESLVWKTFSADPPGTRAAGFGSWGRPPRAAGVR